MKRWGMVLALIGILGTAGAAAAYEHQGKQEGRPGSMGGGMSPEMKAIKEKYHTQKEQLHADCRQKMKAIEDQEYREMTAAMNAIHDRQMKEREERHQKNMQEMDKRMEERKPAGQQ